MKTAQSFLAIGLPSLLAVIFLILFLQANGKINELEMKHKQMMDKFTAEKSGLIAERDMLKRKTQTPQTGQSNNISLYQVDIERLKEKGLADPVNDLLTDLKNHRKLIEQKGVLGGTMKFYESESHVLNNKWVFAYFEDGHVSGNMLLKYEVADDGKITWTKIAETLR